MAVRALALLALLAPAAAFAPAGRRAPRVGRAAAVTMKESGFTLVKPFNGDPTVGHLSTIVTSSGMTKSLMANLPCYRAGLDDKLRGLEVGLAHGYFFYGPFVTLGPLRAEAGTNAAAGAATSARRARARTILSYCLRTDLSSGTLEIRLCQTIWRQARARPCASERRSSSGPVD